METKQFSSSGGIEIFDPNGTNMGIRNPPHHSLCSARHILPPTSQNHGQAPHQLLPNPCWFHVCLHHALHHVSLWLVPRYGLHGIAEAFMSIGHLEFFYDQSPESMRISATALFWTAISVGNYVSTLLVSLVHKYSAKPDGSNWLPDNNLNKGKLELFYWLITGLQVVNLLYYICCAKLYTYKPIQTPTKDAESKEAACKV
ncbi:hypothetical protein ES288_D02G140300v1 [Gossypium darwinii]|uniref:Uncharacterized protein n=1 Tax=Gossypium darwinii TaxID=34276 RepID=A0A5D2DGR5_GOSDA|nr:hypothetical protein GOBAR_DD27357 [Gossypium barbadense]TYG79466.1 hypothetical protein ES288_D02G140300v1 [Gossypium darwinii]